MKEDDSSETLYYQRWKPGHLFPAPSPQVHGSAGIALFLWPQDWRVLSPQNASSPLLDGCAVPTMTSLPCLIPLTLGTSLMFSSLAFGRKMSTLKGLV